MKQNLRKTAGTLLRTGVILIVAAAALTACSPKEKEGSKSGGEVSQAQNADGDLVIPVSEISDKAKFYPVSVDGTQMEVLAVKAPDGTIRTAFNTCQVCYGSGRGYYKQEGDLLVCQNCGNRFSMDLVEVEAGGCNPWPIFDKDKAVTDQSITIKSDFLKESRQIFANWKTDY
ncbi:Fe-S-containing protein [Lacrimispora sp. JR3]|uniref:Fe-S-containing protein n=1 Tax=Lacrimispora sinapis TaxID=3111456 RepID=UPI00374835A2